MIRSTSKGQQRGSKVEAAFQYVNEFHENVLGFCNNIYNAEGELYLPGLRRLLQLS